MQLKKPVPPLDLRFSNKLPQRAGMYPHFRAVQSSRDIPAVLQQLVLNAVLKGPLGVPSWTHSAIPLVTAAVINACRRSASKVSCRFTAALSLSDDSRLSFIAVTSFICRVIFAQGIGHPRISSLRSLTIDWDDPRAVACIRPRTLVERNTCVAKSASISRPSLTLYMRSGSRSPRLEPLATATSPTSSGVFALETRRSP